MPRKEHSVFALMMVRLGHACVVYKPSYRERVSAVPRGKHTMMIGLPITGTEEIRAAQGWWLVLQTQEMHQSRLEAVHWTALKSDVQHGMLIMLYAYQGLQRGPSAQGSALEPGAVAAVHGL